MSLKIKTKGTTKDSVAGMAEQRIKQKAEKDKTIKKKTVSKKVTKKRDSEASKERLMNAGMQCFSKHGFNGVTTKIIAKEACINEALIGRYFGGKEGLFISIVHQFITEMANQQLPYPPQDNIKNELIKYAEAKIDMKEDHHCLGKIIISHAFTDDAFRKRAIKELPMHKDVHLESRLQLLQKKNKIGKQHKIADICEDIETYLHGVFIFDVIMHEIPQKIIMEKMKNFISKYADGIKA